MSHRVIDIHVSQNSHKAVTAAIEGSGCIDSWSFANSEGGANFSVLIHTEKTQELLDKLQSILGHDKGFRIVVLSVEATLPKEPEKEKKPQNGNGKKNSSVAREELSNDVLGSAKLDSNFILLVILSTILAAIGLLENNLVAVIGAMVIAPLLGPNLALALFSVLGDAKLLGRAAITSFAGIAASILISAVIGYFWPDKPDISGLLYHRNIGFDSIALALVSGAAAVLSLTTGLPSVLVGVMVAVALLPPAATLGIMLGMRDMNAALDGGLLLVINIVCVNLAAQLVLLFKGIRPRTWHEKKTAAKFLSVSMLSLLTALTLLCLAIYIRGYVRL